MKVEKLEIEGPLVFSPIKHGDHRGFFSETFRSDALSNQGVTFDFVQDNHAYSSARGVLRGLHYQIPPTPRANSFVA
jgi:dTDP-4-dehydrorhamnose 3,5-epimerase